MAILEVEHINKTFGRTEVLKDISFSLERGQVLSLIGSSGSGKTTLLRCLNFLETPDKGVIRVNDELLFDAANPVTPVAPTTNTTAAIIETFLKFFILFTSWFSFVISKLFSAMVLYYY